MNAEQRRSVARVKGAYSQMADALEDYPRQVRNIGDALEADMREARRLRLVAEKRAEGLRRLRLLGVAVFTVLCFLILTIPLFSHLGC